MTDRKAVLAVIVALAVLSVLGLVGVFVLLYQGKEADALLPLAGGAPSALAAILATTRTGQAAAGEAEAVGYRRAVADVRALGDEG